MLVSYILGSVTFTLYERILLKSSWIFGVKIPNSQQGFDHRTGWVPYMTQGQCADGDKESPLWSWTNPAPNSSFSTSWDNVDKWSCWASSLIWKVQMDAYFSELLQGSNNADTIFSIESDTKCKVNIRSFLLSYSLIIHDWNNLYVKLACSNLSIGW